jgi:OHCU decarboxylase
VTLTVAELDAMPDAEAAFKLASCCGSSKWVAGMVAARPFGSKGAVFAAADRLARELHPSDWLEAFAHHPKIGENRASAEVSTVASEWSKGEQSAVVDSGAHVQGELADANREYLERFGYIFIICASGRTALEILAELRTRMDNDPAVELAIAAREQRLITRLRLNKLFAGA